MKRSFFSLFLMYCALPVLAAQNPPASAPNTPAGKTVVSHAMDISASPNQHESSFAEMALFTGQIAPLTMKLKNLDILWSSFNLSSNHGRKSEGPSETATDENSLYFTQGRTAMLNGTPYLIAYSLRNAYSSMVKVNSAYKMNKSITPDTELHLCLLNLQPADDILNISPFDLSALLTNNYRYNNEISKSNLNQILIALMMYAQDNKMTLPPMTDYSAFVKALYPYVKHTEVFYLPGTHTPYTLNIDISEQKLNSIKLPMNTPVIYEPHAQKDGSRYVGFLDGHVTAMNRSEWNQLLNAR